MLADFGNSIAVLNVPPIAPASPMSETGHVVENDCGKLVPYY